MSSLAADLQVEVAGLQAELGVCQRDREAAVAQVADLQRKLRECRSDRARLESQVEELRRIKGSLEQQLEQQRGSSAGSTADAEAPAAAAVQVPAAAGSQLDVGELAAQLAGKSGRIMDAACKLLHAILCFCNARSSPLLQTATSQTLQTRLRRRLTSVRRW